MSINWIRITKATLFSLINFLLIGCASLPKQEYSYEDAKKITVGYGPEDFEIDQSKSADYQRLLVACDERRAMATPGEIWEINLENDKSRKLDIVFKNPTTFHPHGISIKDDYLFVISHKDNQTEEFYRFKIYKDSLVEDTIFSKGIIGTGNDIVAIGKDKFYYTNFKMIGGNIVYFNGTNYEKIIKHLKYPNGLYLLNNKMYYTTTLQNKLFVYDNTTHHSKKLTKIKGGDNIMWDGKSLYTTSHYQFGKFLKHAKNKKNLSPTVVYSIDPASGETHPIFCNDGTLIPAGSAGLPINGKLYIAQVFENFIWVGKIVVQ